MNEWVFDVLLGYVGQQPLKW